MKLITIITAAFALAITGLHAQLISSTLTSDAKATTAAEQIISRINGEIERRVIMHRELFEQLWNNPNGAAPEAILAKLGTKAALVFALSAENLRHIDECAKLVGKTRRNFLTDAQITPPHAFTIHADGTVTLAD